MSYWQQAGMRVEMGPELPPSSGDTVDDFLSRLRYPEDGLLHSGNFIDYLQRNPETTMEALFQAATDLGLEPDDALDAVSWDSPEQFEQVMGILDSLIEEGEN